RRKKCGSWGCGQRGDARNAISRKLESGPIPSDYADPRQRTTTRRKRAANDSACCREFAAAIGPLCVDAGIADCTGGGMQPASRVGTAHGALAANVPGSCGFPDTYSDA